jgi:hypothetical protein
MCPSRDRRHPSGLMATGKQARGSILWPGRPWPCGLMDTGKQAHGSTLSRVADIHGLSWSQGNDEKDASLGETPAAIGSDPLRQLRERLTASRIARGHAPSSTRGSARGLQRSTKKAAALGLFDTVINGRSVPDRPDARLASRAGIGIRREGPSLVRRRGWASGAKAGRMRVRASPVSAEGHVLAACDTMGSKQKVIAGRWDLAQMTLRVVA